LPTRFGSGSTQAAQWWGGPRAAHAEVRKHLTYADADRLFGDDIKMSLNLRRSCRVVETVEAEIGTLV